MQVTCPCCRNTIVVALLQSNAYQSTNNAVSQPISNGFPSFGEMVMADVCGDVVNDIIEDIL